MSRAKEWLAILAVGMVGGIVAGCFSLARWPIPSIHDEFSHLLVADTLLQGRLSNPTPPVWPVFQAEHVIVTPTYASKYPLGPGALLALGRLIAGVPQAGLWLGAFLASAAVVWMVRSFTNLTVAIWAGLMVALHPFLQSVWSQNFMNGWLALASACLVIGAAIRLRRRWNGPDSAVLTCGAVGLALTRPMEGLLCVVIASMFFLPRAFVVASHWWRGFAVLQCSWFTIPALLGAGLLLAHHQCVTNRYMQMPYQLHEQQYGVAPLWIFENPKTPGWLVQPFTPTTDQPNNEIFKSTIANESISPEQVPEEIKRYHTGWSMDCYRDQTSVSGWLSGCWERLRSGFEYFGLIMVLAMIGVFQMRKWTKVLLISFAVLALFGISTFVPWILPHYFAPLAPWLIILSVVAIRYSPIHLEGSHIDPQRTKKQIMICLLAIQMLMTSIKVWNVASHPVATWSHRRSAIERSLEEQGGKHLILVRYSPNHNVHDEWVYNPADFDSARVLWARSWHADYDQQLKDHFGASRKIWVVEPDAEVVDPKSYSPICQSR